MAKRMAEQMELFKPVERGFEEGGLMDEGGMVDEMSGNEVPPGSLREEVRDDIPAQLSEGEFVFPADVVRYFGLEKLMKMRQEAKMGLKRMEEMGQMGNSEEAIMPDDLPFTLDDLDMEEKEEYNNTQEFARGGVIYAQEGTFVNPDPQSGIYYQPPSSITTGIAQDPVVAASAPATPMGGYTPPQQAFTPVRPPREVTPAFQGVVGFGPEGVEYETVTYVNEAGQTLVLKKNKQTGQLLDLAGNPATVPEGYKLKGEEEVEVAPVTTETTQVTGQDDGGREERDDGLGTSGAKVAWGGTTTGAKQGLKVGSTMVGIGYTKVDPITGQPITGLGSVPNPKDFASVIGGLTLKGELPSGYAATMTIDNVTTPLNNKFFNEAKKAGFMGASADLSLDIAKTNVQAANIMQAKYGLRPRTVAKTIDDIAKEAASSNVGIAELAKDYGIDINTIKDNFFGGKNYEDAVAKAVEAANSTKTYTNAFGETETFTPTSKFTADDIKDGHAARTAIDAHNKAVAEAAAAKNAAASGKNNDSNNDGFNDNDGSSVGGSRAGGGMKDSGDVGYGSGTDCLTEDMKVKLNGAIDFVTNIKVGDTIDNYKVKEVLHKHMRSGYYAINNELKISNDHPVLANGTWTRPEDLVVGDSINGVPVVSLEYIDRMTPTVSIVIDGDSFDVYTEGNTYTVHGRYKEIRQQAA
jgi:hypothetical protein